MKKILLNLVIGGIVLASAALCGAQGQQGQYPTKPITLLVPWTAGGGSDIALRALAEGASKHLGQRIIVENKPGAGGALAAQHMASTAKPDGYTVAQLPLGVFRLPHMIKTNFDPINDLTWVINIAGYIFGTSVRADSPWKTWEELIAYVKANPGKVSFASPGAGTSLHLVMEDLALKLGLNWVHIPFKGTADAIVALRGSQVQVQAGTPPWEWVENGHVRPLVMWGPNRSTRLPNVPTLKEKYGIVANSPWGIGGPKGMDPQVIKILHDAFRKAMDDPAFHKLLERLGMESFYMAGDDYAKWVRRAADEEKRAVERLGLNK
jgi:tripartite-type tricarboxylate transporter receptor subunit TctC